MSFLLIIIQLAVVGLIIYSLWKVFEKAGEPGWKAIVPVYNLMTLAKIGGKPEWWGLLCLIPLVNIVIMIIIWIEIAKKFGKSTGFAVGLALLGIVFVPILAFSDAVYEGDNIEKDLDQIGS